MSPSPTATPLLVGVANPIVTAMRKAVPASGRLTDAQLLAMAKAAVAALNGHIAVGTGRRG